MMQALGSTLEIPELDALFHTAQSLLCRLIALPSPSREEADTAQCLADFLASQGITPYRHANNVWAKNRYFDAALPTVLLNSHHDTVLPNVHYTLPPHEAIVQDGRLYGLGSNDAGGALVALLMTFLYFYPQRLPFNLVWAGTAEEEISGANGIAATLPHLGKVDWAIVGEPTLMHMAIVEKGLVVLDCVVCGVSSHAAHPNPHNPIYLALQDLAWVRDYAFEKVSPMLGAVKMTVTQIDAGKQHNVVPAECRFVIDVRTNEHYTNAEIVAHIAAHLQAEVKPRSLRLNASAIDASHPVVQAGKRLGWAMYGSPTISDQALMPFPSIKLGPGDSLRSHTADEYIYLQELREGILGYITLLHEVAKPTHTVQ